MCTQVQRPAVLLESLADKFHVYKTENPSAPKTMLMMEGPSHFEAERDSWNWAGEEAADDDLGVDSFMWLNEAMENSLMGLNIQAPQQPVEEPVRSEAPKAPVSAAVSGAPVAPTLSKQSPPLAPPAMHEQAPLADDACENAMPTGKPLSGPPQQPAPMALQTPQRLSTSSSHSHRSSSSSTCSSSSSSSRKPRKPRPCPSTLTSPPPSTSLPNGDDSAGKRSPSARIDVRFIPQDPAIAELVRLAGYCPKLELKTPSTKRVGFFLQHLSKKWASVSVIGKLQLFLAPSSSSLRSSPDGKVPTNGPPLDADVSLDTLACHFDIQASKARPILFLCYSLPVDPTPRLREASSWACEDLSNLLCGEPQNNLGAEHEPALEPLQPQADTLSPEDASLLRGLPDVSFSLPEGSIHTRGNPATPAAPSFCWRSELGSLRASASHSSSDFESCNTADLPTTSPKKRPLYSGNQGVEQSSDRPYYQPGTSCGPLSQEQGNYSNGQQVEVEPIKAPGSDKKKRRIAPVLVSATVPALAHEPCKENVQCMG